jgi:hypothetical protein
MAKKVRRRPRRAAKQRQGRKAKPYPSYLEAVAVVLILAIVGLAAVSIPPAATSLPISTETVSSACLSGERGEMDIRASGSSIVITAPIETPTPCHTIDALATLQDGTITVVMSARQGEGFCIQCVGVVTARATIPSLAPGIYGLDVRTPSSAAITTITVSG